MGTSINVCKLLLLVNLMNQIHSIGSDNYGSKLYRCKSGEYVRLTDFCDRAKDCTDGSDEPDQCKEENCVTEKKFLCSTLTNTNFTCVPLKARCDTRKDCPDGSDEDNCGDEVNVNNCPLSKGKFLCKDKLRCLDLEYTCDSYCNCFDCSDENENCTKKDEKQLAQCSHSYFPTPLGLRCFCNSKDGTFNSLCKEMKECPKQNSCDQRCSQYKNKMVCSCFDDYIEILVSNGFKCQSKEYYGTIMIYSTSNHIKSLNVTSLDVTVVKRNVQSKLLAAAQGVIYYTIYQNNSTSIFMISSDKTTEIIKTNSSILSISVDYITDNVYFTTNQSLSVCSKKGEICVQMKCCDVSYVTVAPKFRWMFYTKASPIPNENFIMKSNMDGSNENVLIDGTLRGVTAIAVDESFSRLYWVDHQSRMIVQSISLHDYRMERYYIRYGMDFQSLAVLDEISFYTIEREDKIYKQENIERYVKSPINNREEDFINRGPTDPNITLYRDTNATLSIKYIAPYNSIRHLASKAKNPCKDEKCSGLCLLHPASGNSQTTCVCKDFTPSDDNHWCSDPALKIDSSTASQQQSSFDSDNHVSFVEILFIMIVLAALSAGVYIIYQKYRNRMVYTRRTQQQSERIYDPNQSEI